MISMYWISYGIVTVKVLSIEFFSEHLKALCSVKRDSRLKQQHAEMWIHENRDHIC